MREEHKEDILYFLRYFTHHERRAVYEEICELVLRHEKFLARRSTLLEEDGAGLKLSRVTVLAVDDLIAGLPFCVKHVKVLDARIMGDTRTHILNQLLLHGLMARSAVPLKGAGSAVGEGRKGKVQVLFRKGGPTERQSLPGLPLRLPS